MNHLTNYKHLRGFLHISRLMKKWVFLSFVLIVCMPIKAQVYIGGSLGISVARDVVASSTTRYVGNNYFFVAPEVGYSFNPYLALGASAGYRLNSIADMDNRSYVSASSYIRGTFLHFEHFEMFVDALFDYTRALDATSDYKQSWDFGLAPGFKIPITSRCGLTTRFAFLGWRSVYKGNTVFYPSINFINSSSFGFYVYL